MSGGRPQAGFTGAPLRDARVQGTNRLAVPSLAADSGEEPREGLQPVLEDAIREAMTQGVSGIEELADFMARALTANRNLIEVIGAVNDRQSGPLAWHSGARSPVEPRVFGGSDFVIRALFCWPGVDEGEEVRLILASLWPRSRGERGRYDLKLTHYETPEAILTDTDLDRASLIRQLEALHGALGRVLDAEGV